MDLSFLKTYYKKVPQRQYDWHIEHQIYKLQTCKMCSNIVNWSIKNKKYSTYCSSKCAQSDKTIRQKIENTCLIKYGETTNLKNTINKEKQKETCIKKYGVDNYAKTKEYQIKSKSTWLEKYGVDNPSRLNSIQEKINKTNIKRYNRKRKSQSHIPLNIIELKNNINEMKRLYNDLKMPISEIAELLGVNHSQLCIHFKENLNIDISRHIVSKTERQIFEYIQTLTNDVEQSNRELLSPKELDIVIKSKNIAVEVNGLAWHSELRGKDINYHLSKTIACENIGYRLIHIFDSEWNDQKEIVKSRLSSLLGNNTKIHGRKCTIVELSKKESNDFFNQTHIQGACNHKVAFGLLYSGVLVAAMSFGKSRFNKTAEWELIRYSNKLFTNVIGGASKLLNHFIKTYSPNSIISYCDRRWNNGKLYSTIGFELIAINKPNYWYTKNYTTLENRMNYQKHKLSKKLSDFNQNDTEWDNMKQNGYDRIWDCGNYVFLWKRNLLPYQ